jgi:Flp pilus assembly protein TadB
MMSEIVAIISAVIAVLLGLLGWEKHKNKKKDQIINTQKKTIEQEKKQVEVLETEKQHVKQVDDRVEVIDQADNKVKEQIDEAQTDEEVIEIANDIVSSFNNGKLSDR